MTILRTLDGPVEVALPPIKGSRFSGRACRVHTAGEARAFAAAVRRDHPKATHVAAAWRIADDDHGWDDDGEVAGTAGRPMLDRLVGQGLVQTVLVVVRYYGGTKLGKGGLVRAYGGTATALVDAATIAEEVVRAHLRFTCSHALVGPLRGIVQAHNGELVDTDWGAEVRLTALVPTDDLAGCRAALVERSAGRVHLD